MEASTAARFLDPRTFVLATAAAAPTVGDAGRGAYPTLFALIAAQSNVHLPKPLSPHLPFVELATLLAAIPFTVNPNLAARLPAIPQLSTVQTLADVVVTVLRICVASPDSLHAAFDLVERQTDAAMHGAYEHDSLISCFLRKTYVAFHSLSFDGHARLLRDLRCFILPPHPTVPFSPRPRDPFAGLPAAAINAPASSFRPGLPAAAALLFPRATAAPLAAPHPNHHHEQNPPHPLPHLTAHPHTIHTATTSHYLVHVESLRRRDLTTTLDTLHRYYDCALPLSAHLPSPSTDSPDPHAHQYAALSLAVAHATLGNTQYAACALDDAVRAAHAAADRSCHARALSWLAYIEPSSSRRRDLLAHAADPLALAREELTTVTASTPPDHSATRAAARRMCALSARLSTTSPSTRTQTLLVKAAAWLDHGSAPTALSVARLALRVSRVDPHVVGNNKNMEEQSPSLLHVRAAVAVAALQALQGDTESALRSLTELSTRLPRECIDGPTALPEQELLHQTVTWLRFERALRRGNTLIADTLADRLVALAAAAPGDAPDLALDAVEAVARAALARADARAAASAADALARKAAAAARPARVVDGLRLRAQAYLQGGTANDALAVALAAVSLGRGLGVERAYVRCVVTLAEIMMRLDGVAGARRGLRALEGVLPVALEGLGELERGRTLRVRAECVLAAGCRADKQGEADGLEEVVEMLDEAREAFAKVEDVSGLRECAYLLARVHDSRGDEIRRNDMSRCFAEQCRVMEMRHGEGECEC